MDTMKLAVKWMKRSVTTSDVQRELGTKQVSQAIYKLGVALRAAHDEGMIASTSKPRGSR